MTDYSKIPDHALILPKIEHNLFNSNLTVGEKLRYIKKRCLVAQFLDIRETAPEYFEAIRILHTLNDKMKGE